MGGSAFAAEPVAATPAAPAAKAATPPALAVDGKPATNYGKAVQKAKQVTKPAERWAWEHEGFGDDIIAYRIIP